MASIETTGELRERLGQEEREEVRHQRAKVAPEEQRRAHRALSEGLAEDAQRIVERSAEYRQVVLEREQRVQKLIETPALSRKVQEFEQFHETQAQFDNLPESYRSVILKHHDEVRADLQPIFNAFAEPLRVIDAEQQRVGVVATVEPSDAPPEALALVIPISFRVYTDLTDVSESLEHLIAYRCAALVSGMLLRVGVPSAPVLFDARTPPQSDPLQLFDAYKLFHQQNLNSKNAKYILFRPSSGLNVSSREKMA